MPIENRSSNAEMVSMPEGYMLVERSIWTEQQVKAATACITRLKGVPDMRDCDLAMAAIDAAQCKAPDIALSDLLPVPQPHPDPIAWMVGTAFWWTKEEAERDAAETGLPIVGLGPMAGVAAAEQRSGDPVAWMAMTLKGSLAGTLGLARYDQRLNPDLYEGPFPVFRHADPGEVERLRGWVSAYKQSRERLHEWLREEQLKNISLRAQVAEAHALLREVRPSCHPKHIDKIDAFLSASAEPQPFQPPDCLDCACVQDGDCLCTPSKPSAEPSAPVSFQARVQPWLMQCFGEMIAGDREERNHRFLEEALELVQALGATAAEAHQLVNYVFGRAVGEPGQEVGGVMVTLAALCLANGLDMHQLGETELARIWTKVDAIRVKQASKPQFGPLPGVYPDRKQ